MVDTARLLGGRYEIAEPLGRGGMADVYRGLDTRLKRDVAIKVLREELARDPAFLQRFRREAQSAAALSHPAIVSVFDTGQDTGVPYIIMEYVEGETLRALLTREGRLDPAYACQVMAEVCTALDFSHAAGIVHRDVKPGNVMITPEGEVKVMDFGIARAAAASAATMTQTSAVLGTAQYLSPEQARGEYVDARSDIYSAGCVLYELLTGRPPFTGDSPVAVAYQHVREDPELPSALVPGLDPALDAVVLTAMAKNPANRYQSAAGMRTDLDRYLNGEPVQAVPVTAAEPGPLLLAAAGPVSLLPDVEGERRRRRVVAYGALAVAVLVVFVASLLVVRSLLATTSATVTAPDLRRLSQDEAALRLQAVGLTTGSIIHIYNAAVKDTVLDQHPAPLIRVARGGKVDLTVSDGLEVATVPNLVDQQLADARAGLDPKKFHIVNVTTQDDVQKPKGLVLVQSPAAGRTVSLDPVKGAIIDVTVASGNVHVPDVTNMPEAMARQKLQDLGFSVNEQPSYTSQTPPGMVVNQDPVAGQLATRGSVVDLSVSALPLPSPTPTPTPTPFSPSPTPSTVATATPTATASSSRRPTATATASP